MRLSEERYISLLTDFGFKQELREYEDSLKAYRDIKNSIDTAKEEGREEGRKEEKRALVQKKLEKGKTISQIADDLEDTEENIAHLIEEFHLRV